MEDILCNTNGAIDYLTALSTTTTDDHIVHKQPKSMTLVSDSIKTNEIISNDKANHINSCKVLQRKLELKVEKAKKNYSRVHDIDVSNVKSKLMTWFVKLCFFTKIRRTQNIFFYTKILIFDFLKNGNR